MKISHVTRSTIRAQTTEVLPLFGLAYVVDHQQREWTLTRSTAGPGLQDLHPGQPLALQVETGADFSLVVGYELDPAAARAYPR